MTSTIAHPGPARPRRLLIPALLLAGLVASFALDSTGYRFINLHDRAALAHAEAADWYRLLRVLGYWPTWLAISALVLLADRARGAANFPRRAVFLALCSGLSGLAAEIVKGLVGRGRPRDTGGALQFMDLSRRFSHWSDLSFPSSHAAVAFGAAVAVAWLWPGTRPVMLLLAAGCGLTRILADAHFVSDIYAAALLAYAVACALRRLDERNNAGQRIAAALGGAGGPS